MFVGVARSHLTVSTMSYWFHRNPLKATQALKFEALKKASKSDKCTELLT